MSLIQKCDRARGDGIERWCRQYLGINDGVGTAGQSCESRSPRKWPQAVTTLRIQRRDGLFRQSPLSATLDTGEQRRAANRSALPQIGAQRTSHGWPSAG
jgi:hypothetical protein